MPDLSLDWTLFILRVVFIALLYLFLYQLVRVTLRDLVARAEAHGGGEVPPSPHRSPAGACLIVVTAGATGLDPGATLPLLPTTVVGRHPGSTIVLNDTSVSAEHAEVTLQRGRWWVHDLGSTNGTTVNGAAIPGMAVVEAGDIVQFGRVAFRIQD